MTEKTERQGKVQYSAEPIPGKEHQRIFRSHNDEKEVVALYDPAGGIVEMLKGKESYKQPCIAYLKNNNMKYKQCCKIGTDLNFVPEGAPPCPKPSRAEGQKNPAIVEWWAKYRPDVFVDIYGVMQMQIRVRIDTFTRKIRDRDTGKMIEEPYDVPVYEDVDGFDFSIPKIKTGEHRLIARMKTHLTEKSKDDGGSDAYDDDRDAELERQRDDDL